jgi:hypothetical protein
METTRPVVGSFVSTLGVKATMAAMEALAVARGIVGDRPGGAMIRLGLTVGPRTVGRPPKRSLPRQGPQNA